MKKSFTSSCEYAINYDSIFGKVFFLDSKNPVVIFNMTTRDITFPLKSGNVEIHHSGIVLEELSLSDGEEVINQIKSKYHGCIILANDFGNEKFPESDSISQIREMLEKIER